MKNENRLQPLVMIVDDSETVLLNMKERLSYAGLSHLMTCNDSRQVMEMMSGHPVAVLVLDLVMPHISGEELLEKISREHPEIPVIVLTASDDVETAVRCMKTGAFDYVVKETDMQRLLNAVRQALKMRELTIENQALREQIRSETLKHPEAFSHIITQDRKMLSLFRYVEAAAPSAESALITGETGVGKELFAKTFHTLSGRKGEMVSVNTAGLDDTMFSDTLFGHAKGAYTGADRDRRGMIELASRGTLFLDEIGDLSPMSQVKLLRLLQEGEYVPLGHDRPRRTDARIVAATNRDLREKERFREDLVYRFRTHHIHIPPLRERAGDIPLLIEHFVTEAARALGRERPEAPGRFTTLLETWHFPGNVRELQAVIFDAVTQDKTGILSPEVVRSHIAASSEPECASPFADMKKLITLKQASEMLIDEAMKRTGGNQTLAARMLGISQSTLSGRLKTRKKLLAEKNGTKEA